MLQMFITCKVQGQFPYYLNEQIYECFNFRVEMGHSLSSLAGVPLGDVLVNDVQAVNISGKECLTASLWITGVNGACNYRGNTLCCQ